MTLGEWAERHYGTGRLPTLHDEALWRVAQDAMRERAALLLASERTVYPDDVRGLAIE